MTFGRLAEAVFTAGAQTGPAPRWSRPNHLNTVTVDDALSAFFDTAGDAAPLTRNEAMSIPAMARARHIICTAARLPLAVAPAGYANDALIRQPDPARTRTAVHTDTLDSLLFHGAAVWRVTARYADNRPRAAVFVPIGELTRNGDGWQIANRPVPAADLIFFEAPHEGLLKFGTRALRAALNVDKAYSGTATNPVVAAELHQLSGAILTADEKSALIAKTREAMRNRGIVYTNEAVELRVHRAETENLLIAGRNAAAVDIARTVGIPAPLIDAYPAGSSGTYANFQARMREARDIGVDAYARCITDRLSLDDILPRGVACAHVWDGMLRETFADRMTGYAAALETGVYSLDELREIERAGAAQPTER